MTEIDLNAIVNLFAIQASLALPEARAAMRPRVESYLAGIPGLGDAAVYIGLYDEMLEIQTSVEIPDPAAALRKIAFRLRSRLPRQEHLALFAKFMETGGMASTLAEALGMDSRTETEFRKLCSADPFADPDLDECFLLLRGARIPDSPGRRCHILARSDFAGEFLILKVPGIETYFIRVSDSAPVTADGVPLLPGAAHRLSPTAILADGRSVKIYPAELMAAFSVDAEARGRLDFEGERLDFRYPGSADIGLHDFSFSLRGGSLVAIMGGSGAGKSTLLSILTGKIRPTSGSMRIDGLPWGTGSAATEGFVGYVPQDDLLFEDLSVFENLYYNARLCLADLDDAEIRKRCETTLKELNQLDIASLKVGTPLDKTISGGQRKRLNIALELIREPPILFLDEPTSGLSSADSENVIGLLKAQAAKGRIVVATIHQPSSAVYRMFDRLWVLDAGGRPIFDGNPLDALVHFRTQGYRTGTGEYSCPQCGTVHPEQLFDIIEEKKVDESGNPTKIRKVSPSDWHARYLKAREAAVKPGARRSPAAQSGEGKSGTGHLRRPSPLGQFSVFFIRTAKTRIANRGYLLINLFEPPLLAALAGILFHGSWGIQYVFRENVNLPGYFFMSMVIAVFLGLSVASDEIHRDRSILERERLLRLGWGSYIASKAAWLALVASYQMGIYTLIGNAILQIPDMGAMMWGILASASFCAAILGLIVSATLKSAVAIYILIPILLVPQIMLGGPTIKYDELIVRGSGNRNVPVVAEFMPTRWGFEALMVGHYRYNRFERNFFEAEMTMRRFDYFRDVHFPEMRGLASRPFSDPDPAEEPAKREARLRSSLVALGEELGFLERMSGIPAPKMEGKLEPDLWNREEQGRVTAYLKELEAWMKPIRNAASASKRGREDQLRKNLGSEGFDKFKETFFNKEVEKQVMDINLGDRDSVVLSGTRLVPQIVPIALAPESKVGRAPLFTADKRIGKLMAATPAFDAAVLWAMTALLYAALALLRSRIRKSGA